MIDDVRDMLEKGIHKIVRWKPQLSVGEESGPVTWSGVASLSRKAPTLVGDIYSLHDALPEIRKLASSEDWEKREDAATALVEISKKKEDEVVN